MPAPPCPQPQNFSVVSGFITPATDTPAPNAFAGSITASVIDTNENEPVRILESTDPFTVRVDWCICGQVIQNITGCWNVKLFINHIDGISGPASGQLGPTEAVDVTSSPLQNVPVEGFQRCYSQAFNILGNKVPPGVYSLVAVVTLLMGTCTNPGPQTGDLLGYAQIPVLVFFKD